MTASYPGSVRVFDTKYNVTDTVDASHPNSLQEEMSAVQTYIGANPHISSAASSTAEFKTSFTFTSLSARVANVENAAIGDVHQQYIRKFSDSSNLIATTSVSNIGLVIKAGSADQTANLQEWRNSINEVKAAVTKEGLFTGSVNANKIIGSVSSVPLDLTIEQKATNYPLTLADKNKLFYFVNSTVGQTVTVTVPLNSTDAFPNGSQINFVRGGAGGVAFAGISGSVSVNATPGLTLRAQWSMATLIKLAENTWVLIGDLSA
jgi:hypothetical protein